MREHLPSGNGDHRSRSEMLGDLKDESIRQARKAGEKLSEEARQAARRLKTGARHRAEDGKSELVEQIHQVGGAFKKVARELRTQEKTRLAAYASGMGGVLDRTADYLDDRELEDILEAAEETVRAHLPAVCAAAAIGGFAAARFLRSTPRRRQLPALRDDGLIQSRLPAVIEEV